MLCRGEPRHETMSKPLEIKGFQILNLKIPLEIPPFLSYNQSRKGGFLWQNIQASPKIMTAHGPIE